MSRVKSLPSAVAFTPHPRRRKQDEEAAEGNNGAPIIRYAPQPKHGLNQSQGSHLSRVEENHRWFVLGLVLLTTAGGMMMFSAPFPLLTLWLRDLGISRTQAGALTGLWYLVSACASLPAGWLADRVRLRGLFLSLWALIVEIGRAHV